MTLPTSGPMTAAMINVELGRAANAPFSINGADERALAEKLSGPIAFSDFYGKTHGGGPGPGPGPTPSTGWTTSATYRHVLESADVNNDAVLDFLPDGTVVNVGNSTNVDWIYESSGPANWYTPTTPGIGSSVWVRITNVVFKRNSTTQNPSSGSYGSYTYFHYGSVAYMTLSWYLPAPIGVWTALSNSHNQFGIGISNDEMDPDWTIALATASIEGTIEFSSSPTGTPILSTTTFKVTGKVNRNA